MCFDDLGYDWRTIIPDTTACKHGKGDCEECGTSNRRDVVHTTNEGKGAVGQLIKKHKRRK